MILYLIYSEGLVHIPQESAEDGEVYVDNNFILMTAESYEECDAHINMIMDKQEQ
jgi:hypothetical protein